MSNDQPPVEKKKRKKQCTPKEEKAIQHYMNGDSKATSIRKAGWNPTTPDAAWTRGSEVFRRPHVQERLQDLMKQLIPNGPQLVANNLIDDLTAPVGDGTNGTITRKDRQSANRDYMNFVKEPAEPKLKDLNRRPLMPTDGTSEDAGNDDDEGGD